MVQYLKDQTTRQYATVRRDLNTVMSGLSGYATASDVTTIQTALVTCTMEDVTASRALGTTYQNTSGKIQ